MPAHQVRASIRTADSLAIAKIQLDSTNQLVKVMERRIQNKDSSVRDLQSANTLAISTMATMNEDRRNLEKQRDLQKLDIQLYKNLYKKQKRKTFFTALLGLAGIAGTIYLLK